MGIAPICGFPILPARSESGGGDLSGVFRVEFQREQQKDNYSPHHERADRGLEDEQSEPPSQDEAGESGELQTAAESGGGDNRISIFA